MTETQKTRVALAALEAIHSAESILVTVGRPRWRCPDCDFDTVDDPGDPVHPCSNRPRKTGPRAAHLKG